MGFHQPLLFVLAWGVGGPLHAQQANPAGGGDAAGIGGSMAWTLGQIDDAWLESPFGSMAQGVQHPVEMLTVSVPAHAMDPGMVLWPNPATDQVAIDLCGGWAPGMRYEVQDASGRRVAEGPVVASRFSIPVREWPAASYFILIRGGDGRSSLLPLIKR